MNRDQKVTFILEKNEVKVRIAIKNDFRKLKETFSSIMEKNLAKSTKIFIDNIEIIDENMLISDFLEREIENEKKIEFKALFMINENIIKNVHLTYKEKDYHLNININSKLSQNLIEICRYFNIEKYYPDNINLYNSESGEFYNKKDNYENTWLEFNDYEEDKFLIEIKILPNLQNNDSEINEESKEEILIKKEKILKIRLFKIELDFECDISIIVENLQQKLKEDLFKNENTKICNQQKWLSEQNVEIDKNKALLDYEFSKIIVSFNLNISVLFDNKTIELENLDPKIKIYEIKNKIKNKNPDLESLIDNQNLYLNEKKMSNNKSIEDYLKVI